MVQALRPFHLTVTSPRSISRLQIWIVRTQPQLVSRVVSVVLAIVVNFGHVIVETIMDAKLTSTRLGSQDSNASQTHRTSV